MIPLYIILLLVSILEKSSSRWSYCVGAAAVATAKTRTQPVVELVGPKDFVALGGNDLRIRYRVSSTPVVSETTPPASSTLSGNPNSGEDLSIQLTLLGEDGDESWVATQKLQPPIYQPLKPSWQEVHFECGLIVRGGYYNIRLIEGSEPGNDYDYRSTRTVVERRVDILSNLTILVSYPTIVFEVPHRLETYTTSVPVSIGLTGSLCKPKLPLPTTRLVLTICKEPDGKECFRDFATILDEPLRRLEREGEVTVMIDCHLWSRNASYTVQIQEKSSIRNVIATSQPIKVDWSPGFAINFNSRKSIIPCRDSVQAVVSYPPCILPGKDKIRVYGYESLPVPSFLAPKRFNYISEKQILPNEQRITFPCSMFPQRFSRYCFQYINTAEDDSVAIVVENCIPTFTQDTFSDGGWGSWSSWSPCSATCGTEGKRFRYRFCDSPSPSFGANVCQGNFIEEDGCNKLPECPSEMSIPMMTGMGDDDETSEEDEEDERKNKIRLTTRLQFLNGNVRSTPGCECGCLLYDLVPGFNYSLSVALSSNQSSCADEDEEEHHNLKWVLHASGNENRIRFMIVQVDVQCVTLSFRDGNTTDSNLLEVITMSTESSSVAGGAVAGGGRSTSRNGGIVQSIESTGASLSIAASESSQNCLTPFVYFIASYHIVPGSNTPPQEYKKASLFEWNSYEFWTFIFLKFILTFFILIVLCSTFGGCATKVYRKYKYKELKWGECDEDEIIGLGYSRDSSNHHHDHDHHQHLDNICLTDPTTTASRNTSITLMSFDYAYWKQMQILRLKYFLLRPRVMNQQCARVRSFPTSPTRGGIKTKKKTTGIQKNPVTGISSKSESNLNQIMELELERRQPGNSERHVIKKKEENLSDGGEERTKVVVRGLSNCECIYRMSEKLTMERGGGRRSQQSFKYTPSPPRTKTSSTTTNKWRRKDDENNVKFLKEKENLLKRKESENKRRKRKEEDGHDEEKEKGCESGSESSGGNHIRRGLMSEKENLRKSQTSLGDGRTKTTRSLTRLSTISPSPFDVERDDFDGDLDFEMDYYDYNVLNSGHIPGSFLGLEPAFVLWNSEMYPDDHPSQPHDHHHNPFPDESESIEMETTTTTSPSTSASMAGLLHPRIAPQLRKHPYNHQHQHFITKETSLDTLKFVDEEDDVDFEDDDAATHVSDSIFDNENENEPLALPYTNNHNHNPTTTTTTN